MSVPGSVSRPCAIASIAARCFGVGALVDHELVGAFAQVDRPRPGGEEAPAQTVEPHVAEAAALDLEEAVRAAVAVARQRVELARTADVAVAVPVLAALHGPLDERHRATPCCSGSRMLTRRSDRSSAGRGFRAWGRGMAIDSALAELVDFARLTAWMDEQGLPEGRDRRGDVDRRGHAERAAALRARRPRVRAAARAAPPAARVERRAAPRGPRAGGARRLGRFRIRASSRAASTRRAWAGTSST